MGYVRTMNKPDNTIMRGAISRRRILSFPAALSLGAFASLDWGRMPLGRRKQRTSDERQAFALERFSSGSSCSQSVLEAYAEDYGLDPKLAHRISAGLAAGSTIGGECGAVASAYLVIGLEYGLAENESREQAMHVMMKIKQFVARFTEKHGAINCVELLGLDPTTEEGMKEAMEKNLFATKCVAQVRDAVAILDSLIAEG